MQILRRGLVLGISFGLATGLIEVWLGLIPIVQRRFGPVRLGIQRVFLD